MMETQFRINEDIPGWLSVLVFAAAVVAIIRLGASVLHAKGPEGLCNHRSFGLHVSNVCGVSSSKTD